jgi:hypothetical protein
MEKETIRKCKHHICIGTGTTVGILIPIPVTCENNNGGPGVENDRSRPEKNDYTAGSQVHTIKFARYYIGTDSVIMN